MLVISVSRYSWVLGERIVLNARQYTMVGFLHLFPYIGLAKQKGQVRSSSSNSNSNSSSSSGSSSSSSSK